MQMKRILFAAALAVAALPAMAQTVAIDEALLEWDLYPSSSSMHIYRATGACSPSLPFTEVAVVNGSIINQYRDKVLPRGTTLCWRVEAVVGVETSPPSNMVQKAIPPLPTAPVLRVQ
jgi:hypothetical protein